MQALEAKSKVKSRYPTTGHLELIDTRERTCDLPGCHREAILREINHHGGRSFVGQHYCGFHGARLFGRRDA
jgi:hypothetical protein